MHHCHRTEMERDDRPYNKAINGSVGIDMNPIIVLPHREIAAFCER